MKIQQNLRRKTQSIPNLEILIGFHYQVEILSQNHQGIDPHSSSLTQNSQSHQLTPRYFMNDSLGVFQGSIYTIDHLR